MLTVKLRKSSLNCFIKFWKPVALKSGHYYMWQIVCKVSINFWCNHICIINANESKARNIGDITVGTFGRMNAEPYTTSQSGNYVRLEDGYLLSHFILLCSYVCVYVHVHVHVHAQKPLHFLSSPPSRVFTVPLYFSVAQNMMCYAWELQLSPAGKPRPFLFPKVQPPLKCFALK